MIIRKRIIYILIFSFFISLIPVNKMEAVHGVSAKSAVLIEQESGRVLFGKKEHEKMKIASITKIMTAILAVESGKLNEIVKVSKKAQSTEGSSLYLIAGEKIKLEDLVYGLMLRSGNDAAVAIAEHVGGSLDGFVYLMNQKAEEIGMKNTNFTNPHGLDTHPTHLSTAYDMAILTRYAMQSEEYKKITGTKVYRAPHPEGKWDRVWRNKNRLVTGLYKYSTGGKTGYTTLAKRTLVSTASKDGMDLIAVTLNASSSDWNDHIHMFTTAYEQFELVKVVGKGVISKIDDPFYKNKLYYNHDFLYPLKTTEQNNVHIKINLVKSNKSKWKSAEDIPNPIGQSSIYVGDKMIGEIAIFFKTDSMKPPKKSFLEIFKNIFFVFLGGEMYG